MALQHMLQDLQLSMRPFRLVAAALYDACSAYMHLKCQTCILRALLHAGGATLVKGFLYVLCKALAKRSATALALAEDHRNDIMSNSVAIVTAAVATEFRHAEPGLAM